MDSELTANQALADRAAERARWNAAVGGKGRSNRSIVRGGRFRRILRTLLRIRNI